MPAEKSQETPWEVFEALLAQWRQLRSQATTDEQADAEMDAWTVRYSQASRTQRRGTVQVAVGEQNVQRAGLSGSDVHISYGPRR